MRSVAVLGGGPAGSMAAERLATAGFETRLIDEKLAWEKPCGGGVTWKAYSRYPFLRAALSHPVSATFLEADGTGPLRLDLDHPLLIFSRRELNQLLLDRAAAAGADLVATRVTAIDRQGAGWRITTRSGTPLTADFLVVATGARNPLREVGTAWTAADAMIALGYYIPSAQNHVDIRFFTGLEGYIWVFPRNGHLSAGICGKQEAAAALRQRLEHYLSGRGISYKEGRFYAHMLPSLDFDSWPANRLAGPGWLAAGDAAGLVDPVTGEGIYYAMRSGDLAGQLLADGRPEQYAAAVRSEFADDLAYAATLAQRVYLGRFCGGSNTTRLLQFVRRSRHLHGILQELFAGTLSYRDLRTRIRGNFHSTVAEIAVNAFLRRMVTP
ncbi:MAG: NAD(P)/FAD-dependent oxidoreductase [Acidobacteriaceae bacterium]|nr:NAD(P)/FAD-dependent oxidoreductase [Acidobacteriaceae bacterium]